MLDELKRTAREWPGEVVVVRRDEPTGAWIFVALHSSVLGRPVGGTRMKVYSHPRDGLTDALRLAEGMTYKWASVGIEMGGGKAVLALSHDLEPSDRRGLLRRYGRLVESMDGAFATGEDLGTTPDDMAVIAEETEYVHGVRPDGSVTDPGPFTAYGVEVGLRAGCETVFGNADLTGRTVVIQGVGDVGEPLARSLAAAGARLTLSDLDADRARRLADELGAEVVDAAGVLETECDVLAPCAVGGILDADAIRGLACRMVAGSANNQLGEPSDGRRLHDRGIVYLPDYVVNSGGAIAFGTATLEDSEGDLHGRIDAIDGMIREILATSRELDQPPSEVAFRIADQRIEAARVKGTETKS